MLLTATYHSTISIGELDGTKVIIKRARHTDEPRVVRNWHNEVMILKQIVHGPNMSLLLASDPDAFTITLRQEAGRPLDSYSDEGKRCTLSYPQCEGLARQMTQALAYLHARGIVHDDVKPDNIIFAALPTPRAVLIDFGAAFDLAQVGDDYWVASGTPPYAPPEYLDRKKGPPGDVWGLGVTMLFALGKTPLPDGEWILPHALEGGEARREMLEWLETVEELRRGLAETEGWLGRMLEPDPGKRIAAGEIMTALEAPP